jgi:copper homeostasis protein CutC
LENLDHPLPLNLISTKNLVEELQGRFDVFVGAGIKVRQIDNLSFQFGTRGSTFDVISMMEFLKVELVVKQIEEHNGNGNGTSDFD